MVMQENAVVDIALITQILLVEDQEKTLQELARGLEEAGFSICVTVNGEEAIELFHQHQQSLELVITDFRWFDPEGLGAIARLQELKPSLRFCFVSDRGVQYLDGRLWDLGPSPLLQKPFQMEQFIFGVTLILRPD
jgi:DNA-binding response OmpR family regulator